MSETSPYKSRTQLKKEADALQELGLALTDLSEDQLKKLDIPANLKTAVLEFKSITSKNAARRQRQYIGALMRNADPAHIRRALACACRTPVPESEADTRARSWIDRLLSDGPKAIEQALAVYPQLNRQRLRQLVRNVQKAAPGKKADNARQALQTVLKQAMDQNA